MVRRAPESAAEVEAALSYPYPTRNARLIARENRFVARCLLDGREVSAHVPNTGRMLELMLPDNRVWLADLGDDPTRRFRYRLVAAELRSQPVLVESARTNAIVASLLDVDGVPGLEGYRALEREVRVGDSRIDLLLTRGGEELLLEVKSCTFVQNERAMFPDALSARATRHLQELAGCGRPAAVMFCLQIADARRFTPHFHVDPTFAATLDVLTPPLGLYACALEVDDELRIRPRALEVALDLDAARRHNRDAGAYLLVIELTDEQTISVGALGPTRFTPGFYVYVGSARRGLEARLRRHAARSKKRHWHIDYLLERGRLRRTIAVRGYGSEPQLARELAPLSDGMIAGFGAGDSALPSHLFYFADDPLGRRRVVEWVLDQQTLIPTEDGR